MGEERFEEVESWAYGWDQPAIPILLPPVSRGFRQFWLGQACVEIAGVRIAV
jgi:hypothetical protein